MFVEFIAVHPPVWQRPQLLASDRSSGPEQDVSLWKCHVTFGNTVQHTEMPYDIGKHHVTYGPAM